MRIGQLAQLNEVAQRAPIFLNTTSELYGFFYLKFRGKHRKTLKKRQYLRLNKPLNKLYIVQKTR